MREKQFEIQKSYKRFLRNLPNGIVIFDKNNNIMFCNQIITNIVLNKELNNNSVDELLHQPITSEMLMNSLDHFLSKTGEYIDTTKNLRTVLENWKEEIPEENSKYVYNVNGEEFTYTIKILKTIFMDKKCKVLILQDQTDFERLRIMDSNYRKLYVASIAHDIRTPLNGIIGMLDMMDEFKRTSDGEIFLSVAKKTSKLLLFLTYDITDFSQIEANKFHANNGKVSMKDVLTEVSQLFSFSFERKNLSSSFTVSPNVPDIVCIDKNRYMQILLNLLGNALKFTCKGSIDVDVMYEAIEDIIITNVKDTGIGISKDEIPKLFKLFGKLEKNGNLNPQGVGFGLAICKKLSESLGGFIRVESKPNVGSKFIFGIRANSEFNHIYLESHNSPEPIVEMIPDSKTPSTIVPDSKTPPTMALADTKPVFAFMFVVRECIQEC